MILFDRVSFRYKENQETSFVLEEVSFSLSQNMVHGFIGGNGSGKTTCAHLIAGLIQPVSGHIEVAGVDADSAASQIHRKVGLIFQNPDNQIVGTTVEEDIAFGLENLAVPTTEMPGKILAVAAELGIAELLPRPVHHLSGGQKQLLCIASVLVMEPEWLIFDEPTSHLDPWARREFYKVIKHLLESRRVGIIIISQISEDFDLFDEVKLFSQGKVAFSGSLDQLKQSIELREMYQPPESWIFSELGGDGNDA